MIVAVVAGMFGVGELLVDIGNVERSVPAFEARANWIKYVTDAGIVGGMMLCVG